MRRCASKLSRRATCKPQAVVNVDVTQATHILCSMAKNFTLAIDEELLRQARRYAAERDTTLSGLVREYLSRLVAQRDKAAKAGQNLLKLSEASNWEPELGWQWNREEIYDRGGIPRHQHPDLRRLTPQDRRKKKMAGR